MDKKTETPVNQETTCSRFGLFGDFPTRAMIWGLRSFPRMPYVVEATLLYTFTFVVFLLAHQQREAIRRNLRVLQNDLGWIEGYFGVFQVFANFGWTYIDGLRTRLGQNVISWGIDGMEHFEALRDNKGAAVIFTTHTGNYDLAAAMFSSKFNRALHTVRAPERSPYLQEIRQRELEEDVKKYEFFKVHYNSSENLLGIELAKLLMDGEIVAIQCDRVIADVVAINVPTTNKDIHFRIPKGPMTLASLAKCPCYPLYVIRDAHRSYRVVFEKPLCVTGDTPTQRLREPDFAKAWVQRLNAFLYDHAQQWFVFEDAFTYES